MAIDTAYTRDISLPFRFTADADLVVDENEEVIDQALNLITFIPRGTVILWGEFGSSVLTSVFDPLDSSTEIVIDNSIRTAFEALEPRVAVDRNMIFDETPGENKLVVLVPYTITVTGTTAATRLIIDRPIVIG